MAKEGFLGNLATVKIKSRLVRLAFAAYAETIMKNCILAWVKEAERIIPVYQGEARGSIQPAADLVEYTVKDWGKIFNTAVTRNLPATWEKGKANSSADLQINRIKGTFVFTWESTTFHLAVNEHANVNAAMGGRLRQPGAYEFREASNEAFRKCLQDELLRLPIPSIISRNLEVRTVKLG